MSDDEDYDSTEDVDYVPSDGEAVSEEENSGEEENLDALKEDGEPLATGKRRKKSPKKKAQSQQRKRQGGIQLEGDTVAKETSEDRNVELAEQIKAEQVMKKEEQEKKRSDNLWASFMSDVGKRPEKKAVTGSSSSLASIMSKSSPTKPQPAPVQVSKATPAAAKSTITVTKVFDFAGEAVKVTKELDVNSKEGQAELMKQQAESSEISTDSDKKPSASAGAVGVKRPGGGLGGVLEKINKKPKIGTLEKSKLDWESFKEKEGINEELKIHNRGKESYIERMNFLQRTDHRQFEIEKSLRLGTTSSKR